MAVATRSDPKETWRPRIRQAQEAQKQFHGTWAVNLAFSAGQQWLVWNERQRQLRSITDEDPRYRNRELYTADRIREYIQSALGELSSDDERPELLVAQEGDNAESVAETLNRLAGYAWDHEWMGDSVMLRMRRMVLDLGVAAVRCKWDPEQGATAGHVPLGPDGKPTQDPAILDALKQTGAMPDGSLPQLKSVREGRTVWETYSAFQILTPPGVVHEDDFTWEALMRPVHVDEIKAVYGVEVKEDTDIATGIGLPASLSNASGQKMQNRLRDHAWLYTCFDRPTAANPEGGQTVLGGSDFTVLDTQKGLEYEVGKKPHTGVVYFHWWRLSDRFQSKSFVEPLRDPQRIINRRKTQNVELVDRGMPKLLTRKGDWPSGTTGAPLEIVELDRNAQQPVVTPQIAPGAWMFQDIDAMDSDLSHASTLSALRLGENPASVQTYGQLALLNDNEHGKRATVQMEHSQARAKLVELSIGDIRRYWPEEKQALIQGEEDRIERAVFRKSEIPDEFVVKTAKGQPLPRSQGAEIKKVDSIFAAAVQSGAVGPDPVAWVSWYKRSLEAGSAQDLPSQSPTTQQEIARLENEMMRQGEEVAPAYYDQLAQHLPTHREEEDQARASMDVELASRIERHIQAHLQMEAMNAQRQAMAAGPPAQALAGGPPQAGPPQNGGGQPPIPAFVPQDFARLAGGG